MSGPLLNRSHSSESFDSFRESRPSHLDLNPNRPSSSDEDDDDRETPMNGYDSSAALILVSDGEDFDNELSVSFDLSSDDSDEDEQDSQFERLRSSSIPPLTSISVFLFLLAPLLKLGAILAVEVDQTDDNGDGILTALPLQWAIPALCIFAVLCAFTRQIWYMLAKYVRRADMEEILLQAFARKRGNGSEKRRRRIRTGVRFCVGAFRVLLGVVYLRASTDVLLPLLPPTLLLPTRYPLTLLVALLVSPICFVKSLSATPVLYATWISIATFIAWLACTAYAHAKGILTTNPAGDSLGSLWQGISVIAFAFTTSFTLPLYAALRGTIQPGASKSKRSNSFKLLSLLSVGLAALFIVPLICFEASESPTHNPSTAFRVLMALLNAITLALTIPLIVITLPSLPLPVALRRRSEVPVSKGVLYVIMVALGMVPQDWAHVLSDVVMVGAFFSTYVLPAAIHIIMHNFRRPLSIVIPPSAPITPNPAYTRDPPYLSNSHIYPSPSGLSASSPLSASSSRDDELLQRKEQTLQRRRLTRRIVWDIGVWVLLLPVGGGGLVWAAGRIAGRW